MLQSPIYKAAFWMTGSLSSFMLMAIAGRELATDFTTFQMLFWRSIVGLVIILTVMAATNRLSAIKTQQIHHHFFRNIVHYGGQYGWFLGLSLIPIAQVFAIEFTTPLWTAALATLFFGEKLTRWRLLAIFMGFSGILVILRPGIIALDFASLAVLGAAFCYASTYVYTKKIAKTDHVLTILFYMCAIQLPLGLIGGLENWIWPSSHHYLWVFLVGATALSAHFCLTNALKIADASVVVPMDFLRLPVSAAIGFLIYQELPEIWLLPGSALILLGIIVNMWDAQKKPA